MIIWLVFLMRTNSFSFLSLHKYIGLKSFRTLEHGVCVGKKFANQLERGLVQLIHRLQLGEMVVQYCISMPFPILDHRNNDNQV